MTDAETAAAEVEADPGVVLDAADDDVVDLDAADDADVSDGDTGSDDDGEQEPPEEVEFVFGNEKLRLPKGQIPDDVAKKLDDFTRGTWADYTRKTQEIAERGKSLAESEKALDQLSGLNETLINKYAEGLGVRQQLERLQQVNVNQLWNGTPQQRDQARQVSDLIAQRQMELQKIAGEVGQAEQELSQTQGQERQRRADEGRAQLERTIPEFDKRLPEILDYAAAQGLPKADVEAGWAVNPVLTEVMHKAMLYDRMQAQARKSQPKRQQAKPVAPVATGRAAGRKTADQMSPAEMAKHLGY